MEERKSLAVKAVILVLGIYGLTAGVAATFFNWEYARSEGFVPWLMSGEVVSTAKGFVWPYYAFRSKQRASPFKNWSPEDRANSKHFFLSIQADLQSISLSHDREARD